MTLLVNISQTLIDWLIPQHCILCEAKSEQALCPACYRELPWLQQHCDICALPMASSGTCPECQRKRPSYDRCIAAFRFTEPVSVLINQFKHRRNYPMGTLMCAALAKAVAQQPPPACLVPMPLHWRRLWQRGFNQAVFIGQELRGATKLPVLPLLNRTKATARQQSLDRKKRLKNLKDAFALKSSPPLPNHVALIDDVMTTGATAEAASAVLKHAGVERVDVWVLARTPAPLG